MNRFQKDELVDLSIRIECSGPNKRYTCACGQNLAQIRNGVNSEDVNARARARNHFTRDCKFMQEWRLKFLSLQADSDE
jgi:hypothetical protein